MSDCAFKQFVLKERLAFGAFSSVHLAVDSATGTEVCLKLETEDSPFPFLLHEDAVYLRLPPSPLLCRRIGLHTDGAQRGLSLEVLGRSLSDVRRTRDSPPPLHLFGSVARQVFRALAVVHCAGVVHSDVKPSNFLFRVEDSGVLVVLCDFGLSQFEGEDPAITEHRRTFNRNLRYASLHTHRTGEWRREDDLIGAVYTLSDFWSGGLPWDGRTTPRLILEVKEQTPLGQLLPPEFAFITGLLDKDATQIADAVEAVVQGIPEGKEEEVHYVTDPPAPGFKPKMVKLVIDEEELPKWTKNHSA